MQDAEEDTCVLVEGTLNRAREKPMNEFPLVPEFELTPQDDGMNEEFLR